MAAGLSAQHVEIQGKAKITVMDTANTVNSLVVRKSNGELATRQVSSLSLPPNMPDTTRTFANDLALAMAVCQCVDLPPALVESALDHGYTIEDLIGFDVSAQDLLDGGATPMQLHDGGMPYNEIIGNRYGGGLIFYLDTVTGSGLVCRTADIASQQWGCVGINVPGAQGTAIGTGLQNSLDIDAGCSTPNIAAEACLNLVSNGFSDWYLPSKDEMWKLHISIGRGATGTLFNKANMTDGWYYWTSTEWDASFGHVLCLYQDPTWGCPVYEMTAWYKAEGLYIRPVRTFTP
jgi:hypothetical protein